MKLAQCRKCPFFQRPAWHSGYTGKSGYETGHTCKHKNEALRHIETCELEGNKAAQMERLIEFQRMQ